MSDNGSEFVSKAILKFVARTSVRWYYIDPGKPNQNVWIENFNGKFRDECLNLHMFSDLEETMSSVNNWKRDRIVRFRTARCLLSGKYTR